MGSDHYFHPEFGWLAPTSRLRRELRVGLFSMLFGMSIGAIAVSALSVGSRDAGTNSVSPVAIRGVVAPSITTEASPNGSGNKRREAASTNIDQTRTNKEVSTSDSIKPVTASAHLGTSSPKNAKTVCDGNKSGCLEDARRASGQGGVRSPAENNGPAIARVPLGRAEASTGVLQGSGRSDVAAQGSLAPERTTPPTLQQDLATKDRPNSKAMSRVGRADVRDSSSSSLGFWDWSR
jgi:hypothetical protein